MSTSTGAATHRTGGPTGQDPARAAGVPSARPVGEEPRSVTALTTLGTVATTAVRLGTGAVGRLLGAGLGLAAHVRADKPIHPAGAVLHGRLHRDGTGASGIAWIDAHSSDAVVVRYSRGAGLPASVPDVHGLALRLGEVDLLLSTVLGRGTVPRHVLRLSRDPGRGLYSSLMPFRGPRGPVEIAAEPSPARTLPAAPEELAAALEAEPLVLTLVWATPGGRWRRFGSLEVHGPLGPTDLPVRFDPERAPTGLEAYDWIVRLREPAYAAARRAHPTGVPSDATPTSTPTRTVSSRSEP